MALEGGNLRQSPKGQRPPLVQPMSTSHGSRLFTKNPQEFLQSYILAMLHSSTSFFEEVIPENVSYLFQKEGGVKALVEAFKDTQAPLAAKPLATKQLRRPYPPSGSRPGRDPSERKGALGGCKLQEAQMLIFSLLSLLSLAIFANYNYYL